jgi:hypothetical protein
VPPMFSVDPQQAASCFMHETAPVLNGERLTDVLPM